MAFPPLPSGTASQRLGSSHWRTTDSLFQISGELPASVDQPYLAAVRSTTIIETMRRDDFARTDALKLPNRRRCRIVYDVVVGAVSASRAAA